MGNFPSSCHPVDIFPPETAETEGCDDSDASIIFTGGTILTMVDESPTTEAVAIKGNKILAVGKKNDILKNHEGRSTNVVELQGTQTLMPGLIEPHTHVALVAGFKIYEVISAFSGELNTAKKVLAKIKSVCEQKTQSTNPSTWISFFGWDPCLVQDLPSLSAKELDQIATTRNPVIVIAQTMHSAWINTKGLEVCGITRDTPNPKGGVIVKDKDGNPTGMLKEPPALEMVVKKMILQYNPLEILENVFKAFEEYSKAGFTTVTEMGTIHLSLPILALLTFITRLKECPLRLGFYYPGLMSRGERPNNFFAHEKLFFPGVKIWADGSPYTGTMATTEDYLDTELTRALDFDLKDYPKGKLVYEDDEDSTGLQKQVADIEDFYDVNMATHCHGERAIDQSIDAYEVVLKKHPEIKDHRYRLEHLGMITEEQLHRATSLGITTTFYIDHVYYYGTALYDIIGKEYAQRFTPVGLAIQCGQKHVTLHDDSPSSPIHPFTCMKAAMDRQPITDPSTQLGKQYCVKDVNDVLKAYTINAAWQLKKEKELGSLEVGKFADLVILSDDPRKVQELPNIKAIKTYLGGIETKFNTKKEKFEQEVIDAIEEVQAKCCSIL